MKRIDPVHAAIAFLVVVGITGLFARGRARSACVAAGTPVATPAGETPVERIRVGDLVLAADGEGRPAAARVVALRRGVSESIVSIRAEDGSAVEATPEHPVATERGWIPASAVREGDSIVTRGGRARVRSAATRRASVAVFDLEVEPGRCYFAGGVLVHNKSASPEALFAETGVWVGAGDGWSAALLFGKERKGRGLLLDRAGALRPFEFGWSLDGGTIACRPPSGPEWPFPPALSAALDRSRLELRPPGGGAPLLFSVTGIRTLEDEEVPKRLGLALR